MQRAVEPKVPNRLLIRVRGQRLPFRGKGHAGERHRAGSIGGAREG
ncbi:hypothetical protein trd_A0614 (plasmid) [Thermomicrobium roseum DSM 5159]|uniref:Uncharacterized protein n=1 Tax=Thermomicrobium roseum (strain ATCC 27502 / DSM 5159 / P-2) TaxID=309801 RepID=B9L4A0_THERP|nr:hypothetical protein trd_A0614 [Thermomicrobium roseum DSM 5159]